MPAAAARPLHHIGYWADDLEEAAWRAHRDLGIGPFALAEHVAFRRFHLAGREPDAPVVFDHSAAFAAWGPIVLELGQVHSIDDELAGLYGVREGAVSHVSWLAPDLDAEQERLAGSGCRFINSAETGPVSVVWVTGGALFDHPVELHRDSEFMRGMHGRLADRAREWDPSDGIFVPMG